MMMINWFAESLKEINAILDGSCTNVSSKLQKKVNYMNHFLNLLEEIRSEANLVGQIRERYFPLPHNSTIHWSRRKS